MPKNKNKKTKSETADYSALIWWLKNYDVLTFLEFDVFVKTQSEMPIEALTKRVERLGKCTFPIEELNDILIKRRVDARDQAIGVLRTVLGNLLGIGKCTAPTKGLYLQRRLKSGRKTYKVGICWERWKTKWVLWPYIAHAKQAEIDDLLRESRTFATKGCPVSNWQSNSNHLCAKVPISIDLSKFKGELSEKECKRVQDFFGIVTGAKKTSKKKTGKKK